jgi:hypothetical protein
VKPYVLFGGRTRFAVLEALAEAKEPVTAHQIAMARGLDPAATYRCLAEYLDFGIVVSEKRRNQTTYGLSRKTGKAAAEFLRALQASSETTDLEKWISPEMQAGRMAKLARLEPPFQKTKMQDVDDLLTKRIPGELAALVASSQIAFNELFEQKDGMFILRKSRS